MSGVTVTELPPHSSGAEQFLLHVTQPVDHFQPGGETFQQRVVIRSRGVTRVTTLASTGYGLFGATPRDNEVSFILQGNAITVEHRYYEGSVPAAADPRYLTIRQAAADHHHLVELLRPIFTGNWISTGGSKGGMTSVYHRRFYPDDVDGTVAYVAPQSYSRNDPRYGVFLERVGSPACRQRIIETQRALLDRRAELLPIFDAYGFSYTQVGGLPIAYEHAVEEFRFAFWQYFDEAFCAELPAATADAETLAFYLEVVAAPYVLASDEFLVDFGAYYYQAAAQLGSYGPLALEGHLRSRLEYPNTYRVERYSTMPVARFDWLAMPDIQLWLATRAERVMFVYGENGPWSAGACELGRADDSYKFIMPDGNHGAFIGGLPEAERLEAMSTVYRWGGGDTLAPARKATPEDAQDEDWRVDLERRVPL